jgi:hypothetical protein
VSYAAADFPSPYTAQAIFEGWQRHPKHNKAMRRRKPDGDDWPSDHDAIEWNRIMISSLCLSMIFSEQRLPLFRIML